jgi:hypothetical protein
MSSGRVGGETHSEVADMAVAVDKVYLQYGADRVRHVSLDHDVELQAPPHLERTQETHLFRKIQPRWEFTRVCRCVVIVISLYLSTDHIGKLRTS